MDDEDARKREAELKITPLQKSRQEEWPPGVRPIAIKEMAALGIDAGGNLYRNGKSVAIKRIELRNIELVLAALATIATVVQALVAIFPKFPDWLAGLFA